MRTQTIMTKLAKDDGTFGSRRVDQMDDTEINRNFNFYRNQMDLRMHHMYQFIIARFEIIHKILQLGTR